ncbi:hypothetical protein [Ethanoligenens harbinense]|uniref:Uncharacterized protein n=1 Tax=Ethanoligenens harbinense (strain DSM 18485 / JCM 12961 / CGMCC 1.5033 / YUAN-3) TaxID=663278 RepID=E6U6Q5_ETHHY|nr:hypothetical protein [Ethanoligenens harbinense]ADU25788.1 hypothetical protein Ethha_0201 [Ethanoligenens harbinense YUAN-3]
MEARPFRGDGTEFQSRSSTQDNTAHPHGTQNRQLKTFHNMVQKAKQAIDDHGVKS